MAPAQPEEVLFHQASGRLELRWDDGVQVQLASGHLREACKCAACENARRAGRPFVAADATALTQLHPIGEFGLQLIFNDGHDRGIYPWAYLYELCVIPAEAGIHDGCRTGFPPARE